MRDVASIAAANGFAISHRPAEKEGWLELLACGLTFDLAGLRPAAAAPAPLRKHRLGFETADLPNDLEAIGLSPGPHVAGGRALLPVVRIMTAIATRLSRLDGVRAVCWHPAGTCIEPGLFVRMIEAWLAGEAFPALGLTALLREADGGVRSEGLAFFIGQELWLEPDRGRSPAESAKLAVRLIHGMVEGGPILAATQFVGPDGSRLAAEPVQSGKVARVWRRD